MTFPRKTLFSLLLATMFSLSSGAFAFENANSIQWAGCGITNKAFMAELAACHCRRTITVNCMP